MPDPGGSPDEEDPGKEPASNPHETDIPRNNNYTSAVDDKTQPGVQVSDSSAAADNESSTARSNWILALLLLTLVYMLNS